MKKYNVQLTAIYNGIATIEAKSEEDAICKAQKNLDIMTFPKHIDNDFMFGIATADYAVESDN